MIIVRLFLIVAACIPHGLVHYKSARASEEVLLRQIDSLAPALSRQSGKTVLEAALVEWTRAGRIFRIESDGFGIRIKLYEGDSRAELTHDDHFRDATDLATRRPDIGRIAKARFLDIVIGHRGTTERIHVMVNTATAYRPEDGRPWHVLDDFSHGASYEFSLPPEVSDDGTWTLTYAGLWPAGGVRELSEIQQVARVLQDLIQTRAEGPPAKVRWVAYSKREGKLGAWEQTVLPWNEFLSTVGLTATDCQTLFTAP